MEKKNTLSSVFYISLGYNCFVKKYCDDQLQRKQETNFFDYVGSPMWAVEQLLCDNFKCFEAATVADFEMFESVLNLWTLTHMQLYLRFRHDYRCTATEQTLSAKAVEAVIQKYNRRAKRFLHHLEHKKRICFLRLSENMHKRKTLVHDEQVRCSEVTHLNNISRLFEERFPQMQCHFVLLSLETADDNGEAVKPAHNVHVVDFSAHCGATNWHNCVENIGKVISKEWLEALFNS